MLNVNDLCFLSELLSVKKLSYCASPLYVYSTYIGTSERMFYILLVLDTKEEGT